MKGVEEMTEKEQLFMLRRKKKILLKDIAKEIGCSIALLSKFENNLIKMDVSKSRKYKEFIENF